MAHTPCNFNHADDVKSKSHRRNDKSLTEKRSYVPRNMFATDVRRDNVTVDYQWCIMTCVLSCFLTIVLRIADEDCLSTWLRQCQTGNIYS